MLFQREGYPDEDELVMCTVTKVRYHSVFCTLDEFKTRSGMIHISEVSPGRIRNIRDYVKEGKKVICLVLRINKQKGHIDLSLRRVNEAQRRNKIDEIKQEQKAEKIIEILANDKKKSVKDLYNEIAPPIIEEYGMLHYAFNEVVEDELDLKDLDLKKDLVEELTEIIKDKIKPKEVSIGGEFTITLYEPNGIDIIKDALQKVEEVDEKVTIKYKGGGTYIINVPSKDYKIAEGHLKKAKDIVTKAIEEKDGTVQFKRYEK